jgi:predicted transcriptional regulator
MCLPAIAPVLRGKYITYTENVTPFFSGTHMKRNGGLRVFFVLLLLSGVCRAELPINKKPPLLELKDACGGRLDGTLWSSAEIKDKVYAVYYIDPDEADLNEPLFTKLKAQQFPKGTVQAVAIINMKATWLPKSILNMLLKRKQKKYPQTIYVNDYCRKGVAKWNFADHSNDALFFDHTGTVLFSKDGKLTDKEIEQVVDIIWNQLGGKKDATDQ